MSRIATRLAAATAVALIAGAGAASAQSFGLTEWYVKGFGGATWPSSFDSNLRESGSRIGRIDVDYDTGYTLGLSFGAYVAPNVALEVEYAYRKIDFDADVRLDDGTRGSGSGDTKSNSVMINALYVFDGLGATGQVQPYLGGGLGGAELDFDGSTSDVVLAYQLIAGVGYDVTPNWTLLGEARWFGTQDGKVKSDGVATDLDLGTFDLLIGASYNF